MCVRILKAHSDKGFMDTGAMLYRTMIIIGAVCCALLIYSGPAHAQTDSADLSVQIKKRLYKTKNTIELTAQAGGILNHPYLRAKRISEKLSVPIPSAYNAALTYYFTPQFGLGVDLTYFDTTSNSTRLCTETFFDGNLSREAGGPCVTPPDESKQAIDKTYQEIIAFSQKTKLMIQPAYPPIIEPNLVSTASLVWVPAYGKLLMFMSWVRHFNAYMKIGGGVTQANYYPQKTKTSTGQCLREGQTPDKTCGKNIGVKPDQIKEYGVNGRPKPKNLMVPTGHVGLGLKIHFTQNLSVHGEARGIVMNTSSEQRTDLFYTLWGGLGLRI